MFHDIDNLKNTFPLTVFLIINLFFIGVQFANIQNNTQCRFWKKNLILWIFKNFHKGDSGYAFPSRVLQRGYYVPGKVNDETYEANSCGFLKSICCLYSKWNCSRVRAWCSIDFLLKHVFLRFWCKLISPQNLFFSSKAVSLCVEFWTVVLNRWTVMPGKNCHSDQETWTGISTNSYQCAKSISGVCDESSLGR